MIRIEKLNKIYGKGTRGAQVTALQDINLEIEDGDIYGIIGLSGAGKSTLVRCINLLESPTSGSVYIDGEDLTKVTNKRLLEIRRNIGMIFQNFRLLQQRTIFENVRFPLEIAGVKGGEAANRVRELLKIVGLSGRENAYPSQLSGGQCQRVAIARALATNPKYLLCDEATSALDPTTTQAILALLRRVHEELGVTIVVVTHEMKVVESVCTKLAVIDESRIAESGTVAEVFARPKSEIAKKLILPEQVRSIKSEKGVAKFRLIFSGEASATPVVSQLALKLGVEVNIIFADTKVIGGKTYGQMLLTLPYEAEKVRAVSEFLNEKNVSFTREEDVFDEETNRKEAIL